MSKRPKSICPKCNEFYTNNNIKRHLESCDGTPPRRDSLLEECPYCHISTLEMAHQKKANHIRWCSSNPKSFIDRQNQSKGLKLADAARQKAILVRRETGRLNAAVVAKIEGKDFIVSEETRKKMSRVNKGKTLTEETKQILREKALASNHRRLRRKMIEYKHKDGYVVKLDSTWEEILAVRLDELDINWIRPKPIKWKDNDGLLHNYFPDFYLVDYDVYLDPKNPMALYVQRNKVEALKSQYNNILIIESDIDCRNFDITYLNNLKSPI